MAISPSRSGHRNRLLGRFFEPLAVLGALGFIQGEKSLRPGSSLMPLHELPTAELRREFLDALSYACDFEKGGDTTTATIPTLSPLTYHIGCNKASPSHVNRVRQHLQSVFAELATVYDKTSAEKDEIKLRLSNQCTNVSKPRLQTYQKLLFKRLATCIRSANGSQGDLTNLKDQLSRVKDDMSDFCHLCHRLMNSTGIDFVRRQIEQSEKRGEQHCNFGQLRHYIGRIAYHVRMVDILMEAGQKLPMLLESPEINFIMQEPLQNAIPPLRRKASLDAMARRMLPSNSEVLPDIQNRLRDLDRTFHIEEQVQQFYGKNNFIPIMHAEMIVLEYLHSNREELDLGSQDRYIGCSKPACFCCFLYLQHHPGQFSQPATHQRLYFNWMPPTNVAAVRNEFSEVAQHEKFMLNRMVASIRAKLLEEVTTRSGRRKTHFDSVTGDPLGDNMNREQILYPVEALGSEDMSPATEPVDGSAGGLDEVSFITANLQAVDLEDDDSENDQGGVRLTDI